MKVAKGASDKKLAETKLTVSFDVGHSSIGWAVLSDGDIRVDQYPGIQGCGVVTFPTDDCLANKRRAYRRQRRHIRATRQRIERMKKMIAHLGVMTNQELDKNDCAWPWLLAARVLKGGSLLTWPELWTVVRWYAHNRGYEDYSAPDVEGKTGNDEDIEKVGNARELMKHHGTETMAETLCAVMGLDPLGKNKASRIRYKEVLNAAFPREVVVAEMGRVLSSHIGKLKAVDVGFSTALFSDWKAIPCPDLKLPDRFSGGLLFGRLQMRFDNRLIAACPVTNQKVPSKNTTEFRSFRWAMLLANIKVADSSKKEMRPLSREERLAVDERMQAVGAMTKTALGKAVREATACGRDNLETMFMHPDAERALVLDPLKKLLNTVPLATIWPTLSRQMQAKVKGQLLRKKWISLAWIRDRLAAADGQAKGFDLALAGMKIPKPRGKKKESEEDSTLSKKIVLHIETGRAPYARPLLKQAADEVMGGRDPRQEGGCLFVTEAMRKVQLNRTLSEQTNNHLIRHRLLILERLAKDIAKNYVTGKAQVRQVLVEVNRDLRQMSGMTAKERATEINSRLGDFKKAAEFAELNLADRPAAITAGMIRKIRIAQDLDWTCPYTGQVFDIRHLLSGEIDKDHVVPRSDRASDAMDSLVLTYKTVNLMKGRRTAMQFITDDGGKKVEGMPNLSLRTPGQYEDAVKALDLKGHDDDRERKKRRKKLMMLERYEEKEFTPKDLTVTSQLVRLGAMALEKTFGSAGFKPRIISLPGSVTGRSRRSWSLLGCLREANGGVIDENGVVKTKTEIRDITHLHHALDACVMGLVGSVIPADGSVWNAMLARRPSPQEAALLRATGAFVRDAKGHYELRDLPAEVKAAVSEKLAERRVVQHVPVDMSGMRADETVWRLVDFDDDAPSTRRYRTLFEAQQLPPLSSKDASAYIVHWVRRGKGLESPKNCLKETDQFWLAWDQVPRSKLVGLRPGKLKSMKAVKIISDNYGVAIEPTPKVIPFHQVWHALGAVRAENNGKKARVLRNGQIIKVEQGQFQGVWKVFSTKNNATGIMIDMGKLDVVRLKSKVEGHKINVRLGTLLKDGLTIPKTCMTGLLNLQGV